MLTTAELRWFNRGTLPKEISDWFNCLGDDLAPPEERVDLYLSSIGCDYLGIKLRQGRLEIKWRQAELGRVRFADGVEGKAEKWGKLLCEGSTADNLQLLDVAGRAWVNVKKVRSQRQYQVVPGKFTIAVPVTESIDQGCNVELTHLGINGNAWWSLAFEAFGTEDCLMDNLQTVANWVFNNYRGPKLQFEDSYAYPRWLGQTSS